MKKIIICVIAAAIILIGGTAWAAESQTLSKEEALEVAMKVVKVTEDYTLRSVSYRMEQSGAQFWNFGWEVRKGGNTSNVWAEVDAGSGKLRGFNQWSSEFGGPTKIDRKEAQMLAEDFARQLEPDKFRLTVLQPNLPQNYYEGQEMDYNFSFNRVLNGFIVWDNGINITISRTTGKVMSYTCMWDDIADDQTAAIISQEKAREEFFSKVGLELGYVRTFREQFVEGIIEKEKMPPYREPSVVNFLGYYPRVNTPVYVDAYSGALLGHQGEPLNLKLRDNKPIGAEAQTNVSGKVDMLEAQSLARAAANIPDSAKLSYVNYNEDQAGNFPPTWSFSWSTGDAKGWQISVGVNANTGEVTSLDSWFLGSPSIDNKISRDKAKEIAVEFLGKMAPGKLKELTFEPFPEQLATDIYMNGYDVRFTRVENGLPYPDNGITVGVAGDGTVIRYWTNWEQAELPDTEGIISQDKAKEIFQRELGFELGYVKFYKNDGTFEVKLAYRVINFEKFINAKTGEIESRYGPVLVKKSASNLAGHWAEKDIENLIKLKIINFDGAKFEPEAAISRAELIEMLIKALGLSQFYPEEPSFDDVGKTNGYYGSIEAAAKAGIISGSDGKFGPADNITREQLAVILVKAVGNDENEDLKELKAFKDAEKISGWAQKAVGAAYKDGLLKGSDGYFSPKGNVTKAQAAAIIARLIEQPASVEK